MATSSRRKADARFTVHPGDLRTALDVFSVVCVSGTKRIWEQVLIHATKRSTTLTMTDLEVTAHVRLLTTYREGPTAKALVPLKLLRAIAKSKAPRLFTVKGGDTEIATADLKTRTKVIEPESVKQFPDVGVYRSPVLAPVPGLGGALVTAKKFVAKEATRFALNGIQLGGKMGHVAATDGRRLFVQEFGAPMCSFTVRINIPKLSAKLLKSINVIEVPEGDKFVNLWGLDFMLTVRTLEGNYPDVYEILDPSSGYEFPFDLSDWGRGLVETLPTLEKDMQTIEIAYVGKGVTFRTKDGDGETTVTFTRDETLDPGPLLIGLNYSYLKDILEEGPARMRATPAKGGADEGSHCAVLFYGESDPSRARTRYLLIMPVLIERSPEARAARRGAQATAK